MLVSVTGGPQHRPQNIGTHKKVTLKSGALKTLNPKPPQPEALKPEPKTLNLKLAVNQKVPLKKPKTYSQGCSSSMETILLPPPAAQRPMAKLPAAACTQSRWAVWGVSQNQGYLLMGIYRGYIGVCVYIYIYIYIWSSGIRVKGFLQLGVPFWGSLE